MNDPSKQESSEKPIQALLPDKTSQKEESKKKFPVLLGVLIFLVVLMACCCLCMAALLGLYLWGDSAEDDVGSVSVAVDDGEGDNVVVQPEQQGVEDDEGEISEPVVISRTPSEVDTNSWETYTDSIYGATFMHPPTWIIEESCEEAILTTVCSVEATDGEYVWTLDFDPFLAGARFAYMFDGHAEAVAEEQTPIEIDGYETTMVSHYFDVDDVKESLTTAMMPVSGEIWGGSIAFTDPEDPYTLGFGPGDMSDDVDNNLWSVRYEYKVNYAAGTPMDYTNVPVRSDVGFEKILDTLDTMTVSLDVE